ncbi:MAG: ATP-binding cassette domain-containing protein [Pseudomonadota bacterium]
MTDGIRFDQLWQAFCDVGSTLNLTLSHPPAHAAELPNHYAQVMALAEHYKLRARLVKLKSNWWKEDYGPLLVFYDNQPCAVLPSKREGRYQLLINGEKQEVSAEMVSKIAPIAYVFHQTFPHTPGKAIGLKSILYFAFTGHGRLVYRILSIQLLISLFALLTPIITGMVIDRAIPNADPSLLTQFIIILVVNAGVITLFSISQAIAMINLRFKLTVKVQTAVWDHLLRLPVQFFQRFTAGDIVDRASGIDSIQQLMTGNIITSTVGGIMSIVIYVLLFYYSARLGFVALALGLLFIVVNGLILWIKLTYERQLYHLKGEIDGFLLQLIHCLIKLRSTSNEKNGFNQWLGKFTRQNRLMLISGQIDVILSTFNSVFMLLSLLLIFVVVYSLGNKISLGQFVAFNAAFAQLMMALNQLVSSLAVSIAVIPLYERIKPIIQEQPESVDTKFAIGDLNGEIAMNHLSFSYHVDQPLVIKDLSLTIKPGEHIAIIGHSGAGKSTFIKLLLGFLMPSNGSIYFDGQNLHDIDVRSLRKQIGVVLQNSSIIPGTIIDNILSFQSQYSEEQAWWAAEQVMLKETIQAMPMGMQTILTEGGKTLSGGQRQRVLIARALLNRPKILLLDEATSSLDLATQTAIMANLTKLNVTVIHITQRLETLNASDKVYQLQSGQFKLVDRKAVI